MKKVILTTVISGVRGHDFLGTMEKYERVFNSEAKKIFTGEFNSTYPIFSKRNLSHGDFSIYKEFTGTSINEKVLNPAKGTAKFDECYAYIAMD